MIDQKVGDRRPSDRAESEAELLRVTRRTSEDVVPRSRFGFRTRLTFALVAAAVLPVAGFGLVALLVSTQTGGVDATISRLLVFAVAVAFAFGVVIAYLLASDLTAPLRAFARAVERVSAGDLATPIDVSGDDEFARLAESHNRLAADVERRNRQLRQILEALEGASPRLGIAGLVAHATTSAKAAFAMIDAQLLFVDPRVIPPELAVPGDPRPVRADLRIGDETMGVIAGHLPATRTWERADQDLLDLFASEIAVAIRNAELFDRVEEQNRKLVELDAAKDDFLRGVSHNLQTPLASIRAYADQLGRDRADRRLGIIAEQSDRLSRMVRQLLTVSRLESGALRPRTEVLALGPRVRRTWEALARPDVDLRLTDRTEGWLAIADGDQLDQVLWALLDNAVKYGGRQPIDIVAAVDKTASQLRLTIADHGAGISEEDRGRLFGRFVRGAEREAQDGSGLGLYVSRELCRAMGGDLELEPPVPGRGAAFTISLPGELGEET